MGILSFEEATELAIKSRWKTEVCNSGEECWCRLIVPETPIQYEYNGSKDDIYIAGSGCVPKDYAEHIVKIHNEYVDANTEKNI